MGGFLAYSIVSGMVMLAMYLVYKLFLARDNQHAYNRKVLLAIYMLAFSALPAATLLQKLKSPAAAESVALEKVNIAVKEITDAPSDPIWGTILIWVFIVGMAIAAIKTLITWARLIAVVRSGEIVRKNGYTFVLTDNDRFAPFSWVRYIVISRSDYADNKSAIVAHEMQHIALRHWIDLLIAQIVCVINWFNPAAWLMREELMLVHEYQADLAVIDSGHNPRDYQMLLIKKTVGSRFPSLANSLNHSKLKKRITMMHKTKSGAGQKLKALALVPTLALALGVVTVPAVRAAISTISSSKVSISKGSEKPALKKMKSASFTVKSLDNYSNETTVVINGENLGNNITVSGATFTTMGKTYKDKAIDFTLSGDGNAVIIVKFQFLTEFENTSMTLTVNGEVIPFNLENFFNKAQPMTVQVRPLNLENKTASSPHKSEMHPDETSDDADVSDNDDEAVVVSYGTYKKTEIPIDNVAQMNPGVESGSSPSLKNAEIYLDGEKISDSELNKIPNESIESIEINKTGNTNIIKIVSKKKGKIKITDATM